jgi:very-short-patch-repair endonuclease
LGLKYRKKDLRHNQTFAEKLLWQELRRKKLKVRFHRQYGVGPYILDFYCPQYKIAIELDGGQHKSEESIKYDKYRSDFMSALGIKTFRFWNSEVTNDLNKIITILNNELNKNSPSNPPLEFKRGKGEF